MKYTPHPFQQSGIEFASEFLQTAGPGDKLCLAAPTGCGKSIMELHLLQRFSEAWLVSPREEIINGMLEKLDDPDGDMLNHRICTPIRLRNMLLQGKLRSPRQLIFDEGHHSSAESWRQLDLLTGLVPCVALTATPYRGSPRSTREFYELWGEPQWVITYQEAVDEGFIKMPRFQVLPLVDDDIIEVKGSDFDITSIESSTVDRLGDLAEHSLMWYKQPFWDKPTIYALPSSVCCQALQHELGKRGIPSFVVSAETPRADRELAFKACVGRVAALLHINIVTEGVDLPLRRLVDCAPTLSPVKWAQQLGRITRPTEETPEYWGTNRNVFRHAYVLEGAVPSSAVADVEAAFGPTSRAHARVLGLEAIGRFKPAVAKLLSGVNVYTYALSAVVNNVTVEFCALVHPAQEPVWACKVNTVKDGVKTWGSWQRCDPPNDLVGFSSVPPKEPSPKQLAWWKRSAAGFGLDPAQEVTRKSFQALPVMADLGVRMR